MSNGKNISKDDNGFYFLDYYHTYWKGGEKNPQFNEFSNMILNYKKDENRAIMYFYDILNKVIRNDTRYVVVCVPSHEANKLTSNHKIIDLLCKSKPNLINGGHCLVRHKTVEKLSSGGRRDESVHIGSIKLVDEKLLQNQSILIIDDVTTTGNSMKACQKIIETNVPSALRIVCLAFGRTIRD